MVRGDCERAAREARHGRLHTALASKLADPRDQLGADVSDEPGGEGSLRNRTRAAVEHDPTPRYSTSSPAGAKRREAMEPTPRSVRVGDPLFAPRVVPNRGRAPSLPRVFRPFISGYSHDHNGLSWGPEEAMS